MSAIKFEIVAMTPPSCAPSGTRFVLEGGEIVSVEYQGSSAPTPWWDCKLTVAGEVFDFPHWDPAWLARIIANAIAAALSGDEQDNRFDIPDLDAFVRISLAGKSEAVLLIIFGGVIVERVPTTRAALTEFSATLRKQASDFADRKDGQPDT